MVMYSILPFSLIVVFNSLLIYTILKEKKRVSTMIDNSAYIRHLKKKNKTTRTIVIITFLFILFSLPTASIQGNGYNLLNRTIIGKIIVHFFNLFSFFYQGLNFLMLYFTNKKFKREYKALYTKYIRLSVS